MADSAGATKVRFTLDWRLQKGESLLTQPMAELQGSGCRVKRRMDFRGISYKTYFGGLDFQWICLMIQRRGVSFMIEAVAIPAGPAIHIVFDAPLSKKEWKGAGSLEWCLRIEDE